MIRKTQWIMKLLLLLVFTINPPDVKAEIPKFQGLCVKAGYQKDSITFVITSYYCYYPGVEQVCLDKANFAICWDKDKDPKVFNKLKHFICSYYPNTKACKKLEK
jgi:hypothetical protein